MKKLLNFLIILSIVPLIANDELKIEAKLNLDMSSRYFAYIDFDFENNSQEWQVLENIKISLGANKDQFVEILNGQKYNAWLQATITRNKEREANTQLSLAIIGGIGGALIGSNNNAKLGQTLVAGAVAVETLSTFNSSVSAKKIAETLPENHIYKKALILPPGLTTKRFIVLNSKNHKALGYINTLKLSYILNNQEESIDLQFRGAQYIDNFDDDEESQAKTTYSWQSDI